MAELGILHKPFAASNEDVGDITQWLKRGLARQDGRVVPGTVVHEETRFQAGRS